MINTPSNVPIRGLYEFITLSGFECRETYYTSDDYYLDFRRNGKIPIFIICWPDTPAVNEMRERRGIYTACVDARQFDMYEVGIVSCAETKKEAWKEAYEKFRDGDLPERGKFIDSFKAHHIIKIT